QAEDGIRDYKVTGVQTCALPICPFQGPDGGRERSLGSGVILNSNGFIITNFHVVDGADRIRVQLKDEPPGVLHDAKVIGSDQETDLAVIKIEPPKDKTLAPARLGDS